MLDDPDALQDFLCEHRLFAPQDAIDITILTGGVARVDGKSPVEYLETEEERSRMRSLARTLLQEGVSEMTPVCERVADAAAHA